MADQTITLGKEVNSINWVNGGISFPVEELYLDGVMVWPDPNWAKSVTIKGYRYRGSASYAAAMSYLPSDFNNGGWEGSGEPWPRDSDYTLYKTNKIADGHKTKGTQAFYYDINTGAISPSHAPAEIQAVMGSSRWSIKGATIPANNIPFTYGSVKGRKNPLFIKGEKPKDGNSVWSSENEGLNGKYLPVFYKRKSASDAISTKESARAAFLYSSNSRFRVSSRRPSRSGFYFTEKKLTSDDLFTGIYTTKTSAGVCILLGVYYPDFPETGLAGGSGFRFEIRTLMTHNEYKFGASEVSTKRKRMDLWEHNVYYDNTLSHPGSPDVSVKTVNIGRFGPPSLWTTDSFPDASNDFYGPIESTFTWEIPQDQRPIYNESFKWKKEGEAWSSDSVVKTYWNPSWPVSNFPGKLQDSFEIGDLSVTAEEA